MPDKNVYLILNRAFVDEQFRRQLEADLEGTIKSMGIELSDEALAELMTALDEGGDFATGLDQRLSQSGISLNPAALLRQKVASGRHGVESVSYRHHRSNIAQHFDKKQNMRNAGVTPSTIEGPKEPGEPLEADELDIEVERD